MDIFKKAKSIIVFLLIVCITAASLSACAASGNSGDETTVPLDKLTEAVFNNDINLYKSAFPPDYINQLSDVLSKLEQDINKILSSTVTDSTNALEANYGKKTKISYVLKSKTALSKEELQKPFWDIYLDNYSLPVEKITDAFRVTVDITVKGSESSTTKEAQFTVIKIDGTWYLHPESFMTTFNI